jgi:hypothetical protein
VAQKAGSKETLFLPLVLVWYFCAAGVGCDTPSPQPYTADPLTGLSQPNTLIPPWRAMRGSVPGRGVRRSPLSTLADLSSWRLTRPASIIGYHLTCFPPGLNRWHSCISYIVHM